MSEASESDLVAVPGSQRREPAGTTLQREPDPTERTTVTVVVRARTPAPAAAAGAGPGWDACTGSGTPDRTKVAAVFDLSASASGA